MKTLLLPAVLCVLLGASIIRVGAQTIAASPAATVSPRPTPGRTSPSPHSPVTARPIAGGSATAATSSPSTGGGSGARVSPTATVSPSGGAQLEGDSSLTARESSLQAATPTERAKPTPSRPHRKLERREANTPAEKSREQH